MIAHIQGVIANLSPSECVIDVECSPRNSVGYVMRISLTTYQALLHKKDAMLLTHLIVTETSQTLYGFYTREEREMFLMLISVSGVGPTTALMLLSSMTVAEVAGAIGSGREDILIKAKGIGKKTAAQIILDLKAKVPQIDAPEVASSAVDESVIQALVAMGYTKSEAKKAAQAVLDSKITITDIAHFIKECLKLR